MSDCFAYIKEVGKVVGAAGQPLSCYWLTIRSASMLIPHDVRITGCKVGWHGEFKFFSAYPVFLTLAMEDHVGMQAHLARHPGRSFRKAVPKVQILENCDLKQVIVFAFSEEAAAKAAYDAGIRAKNLPVSGDGGWRELHHHQVRMLIKSRANSRIGGSED